jgi:large-conductance mechanosensitive channel
MKVIIAVACLCAVAFAAESPKEKALRQQLETLQVSLNRANAATAKLQADIVARTKDAKSAVVSVSKQAAANAIHAQMLADVARQTAEVARQTASTVAASNRTLIMASLVGQLVAFLVLLAALAFVIIDVRTKASRDRSVFLESADTQRRETLELMTDTKSAMIELVKNTNHRMDLLLEAKDALRISSNASEHAKGVIGEEGRKS